MKILGALVLLAVISLGGGMLVLLAYGVGQLVNHVLEFSPFEATVLSFGGIIAVVFTVVSLMKSAFPLPFPEYYEEDEDDDEYDSSYSTQQSSSTKSKTKGKAK